MARHGRKTKRKVFDLKGRDMMNKESEYRALLEEFLRWVPCDREDSPIYDLRRRVEAALKGGA